MVQAKSDSHLSAQGAPSSEPPVQEAFTQSFSAQDSATKESSAPHHEEGNDASVNHADDVNAGATVGLLETVEALWNNLQALVHDQLQLAVLETLRVGKSLVVIAVCTMVIAMLIVSTWLCLVGALVMWFNSNGVNTSLALLLAFVINLFAIGGFVLVILKHSYRLRFPATMNSLKNSHDVNHPAMGAHTSATGQR